MTDRERFPNALRSSYDVVVLGGGLVGMATAWELTQRGHRVRVIERSGPGSEASQAGAGMLAPTFETSSPDALNSACVEARDLWPCWLTKLRTASDRPISYDRSGSILVGLDGNELAAVDQIVQHARALGEPVSELSLSAARSEVPDLSPKSLVTFHLGGEHRVDNRECCEALFVALERAGVEWIQTEVHRLRIADDSIEIEDARRETFSADRLVVTAGAWSARIAGLPDLPVRPVRGQMIRIDEIYWPWQGIVRGPHDYAVRRGNGLVVGATLEEVGFDARTDLAGLAAMTQAALRLFPSCARNPVREHWAGLRPATTDDLPLLGQWPDTPIIYATGHYRNGILLSPWTAQQVAEIIEGQPGPAAFAPERLHTTAFAINGGKSHRPPSSRAKPAASDSTVAPISERSSDL